ncbi:hypothetical protein PsAD26_04657 [Pseudovibrio sp. Ad26]|nr:hypothetical protein PsAD26_04657 [Pseudovibrio sp. Ad26]
MAEGRVLGGDKLAGLVDIDSRQLESICPPHMFSGDGQVYVGLVVLRRQESRQNFRAMFALSP